MKNLFSTILLLLVSSIVLAQYGAVDTLITPISADILQDTSISSDIFSILNGKANENLYTYRHYERLNKRHLLHLSVVSDFVFISHEFYLSFSEPLQKTKEKRIYQTACSSSLPFINGFSYLAHGKGSDGITTRALSAINQEIVSAFNGQSIQCIVKAYTSKDYHKRYCHLHLESGSKKLDYIFIIKNGDFYQFVVQKNI